MNGFLRNYATPLGFVTFAAIGISGILMLVGIRNHDLSELHEKLGILFVLAAVLHIVKNRKAFANMVKQTRSKIVVGVLGVLLLAALAVVLLGGGGESGHGGGPYVALEQRLSYPPINTVAPAIGLSSSQVISRLRKGGISVTGPGQNLADIAQKQGVDVSHLIALIVTEPKSDSGEKSGADND